MVPQKFLNVIDQILNYVTRLRLPRRTRHHSDILSDLNLIQLQIQRNHRCGDIDKPLGISALQVMMIHRKAFQRLSGNPPNQMFFFFHD